MTVLQTCSINRLSKPTTFTYFMNMIVAAPTADDSQLDCDSRERLERKAASVLSMTHPLINQYWFPLTVTENVDRHLLVERLTPIAHFFRDSGPMEVVDVTEIVRVLTSLKQRNHIDLLAALTTLKVEEYLIFQLHNSLIVNELIEGIFLNLSFKNIRSNRVIPSPIEPLVHTESNPKTKVFDFVIEDGSNNGNGKLSAQTELASRPNGSTLVTQSQKSISLVSKTNSKTQANGQANETQSANSLLRDSRIAYLYKLIDELVATADERTVCNLCNLLSSLLIQSKTGSNLRILLDEVLYHSRFQEKLTQILFKSKPNEKFQPASKLLLRLISQHEDYFFFRNKPENPVKLSPPFYRFMNDLIEPLNEILTHVR